MLRSACFRGGSRRRPHNSRDTTPYPGRWIQKRVGRESMTMRTGPLSRECPKSARAIAAIVLGGCVTTAIAQQLQPAFRSGVDLMAVDVEVVDRNGAPVIGLDGGDFHVT